jgi:hypothetical protein
MDGLFDLPPTEARPSPRAGAGPSEPEGRGRARLRLRTEPRSRPDRPRFESRLPADHRARLGWGFVESLDRAAFRARIRAVAGHAGRPPIDPAILVSVWLSAAPVADGPRDPSRDPDRPLIADSPPVAEWRTRLGTPDARPSGGVRSAGLRTDDDWARRAVPGDARGRARANHPGSVFVRLPFGEGWPGTGRQPGRGSPDGPRLLRFVALQNRPRSRVGRRARAAGRGAAVLG